MRTRISEHERVRRASGFAATVLAQRLGYSHAYVSRIEGGEIPASQTYRERFTDLLEISPALVFKGNGYVK